MIVETYPEQQACPVFNKDWAVTVTPGPANFFRCSACNQVIKQNEQGRLVAWLNIHSAGRKRGR